MTKPIPSFLTTPILYIDAQPATPSQLAQKLGSKDRIVQTGAMDPGWPLQDPARRMTNHLQGQLDTLESFQQVQSKLHQTFFQHQNADNRFQGKKTLYEQSRGEENKRNASLADRLQGSGPSFAVYRPSEGGLTASPASNTVDKVYITVRKTPAPPAHPMDASGLNSITQELVRSSSATHQNDQNRNEMILVANSYYTAYLKHVLERIPGPLKASLVFEYKPDLPMNLPPMPGIAHEGFVFKGSFTDIDIETQKNLLKGKYTFCRRQLYMTREEAPNHPREIDVIITGTTEKKCEQFGEHFLRSAAICLAAEDPVDQKDFYAQTEVFQYSQQKFEKQGTLATIPQVVKEEILLGNFTACSHQPSPSSSEDQEIGAVVTGIKNPGVCTALDVHKQEVILKEANSQK